MAYQDKYVVRIDCKSEDGTRICYEDKNGVKNAGIPEGYTDVIYYRSGTQTSYPVKLVRRLNEDGGLSQSNDSAEDRKKLVELKEMCGGKIEYKDIEKPLMKYSDITDTEMFGFKEIPKNVLASPENGIWAYHGLRKFKFHFEHLQTYADEWEISANLIFDHIDNDEMTAITSQEEDIIRNEIISPKDFSEGDSGNGDAYEFFVYVNTNRLGDKFTGSYASRQTALFSGYIQIRFDDERDIQDKTSITYVFPVELYVNNTHYEACKKLKKREKVAIDFGTSSSCVAVRGDNGIELITLSAKEEDSKDVNIYENPTCIMVYRWNEIYQQWRKENDDFPLILKGDLDEYKLNEKSVQFDFGYSVKNCLKEVNDKELNSILTEIKMIPKMLAEGNQISVEPLVPQDKKRIELIDSCEQQDETKLDIIAFYGYILGKAINHVEKNRIYTKFQITYPVKFNNEVREKVRSSLEYGLRRSLPKPLRTEKDNKGRSVFEVKMSYAEPVAYIGSVCGKYLKLEYTEENKAEAQMFAVFDFGGGTLDYSFGVFAEDKEDPNNSVIHILGVDGDSDVGGELLIKKLAYWIYTSVENLKAFVEKEILFEQPKGEVLPDDCPEELFNTSANAKSNVKIISERFARDIFQATDISYGEEDELDSEIPVDLKEGSGEETKSSRAVIRKRNPQGNSQITQTSSDKKVSSANKEETVKTESVPLYDVNGEKVDIEVTVDKKELMQKLRKVLKEKVLHFEDSMERAFKTHENVLREQGIDYKKEKVLIFEAGNSSRNKILQNEMKEKFPDNEKLLIDETDDDFMADRGKNTSPKKVALTPKTAVAFGQVILGNYTVEDSYIRMESGDAPFNWYVGVVNRGNNEFRILIDKTNTTDEWKRYGVINSEDMQIYYAETPVSDADDPKLLAVDAEIDEGDLHKVLYIKANTSDSLKCCVCERDKKPDDEEETQYFDVSLI